MMFMLGFAVMAIAASEPASKNLTLCSKNTAKENCGERKCISTAEPEKECFWNLIEEDCHCEVKDADELDDFFGDWNEDHFFESTKETSEKTKCHSKKDEQCGEFLCVMNDDVKMACRWERADYFCHCSKTEKKVEEKNEEEVEVEDNKGAEKLLEKTLQEVQEVTHNLKGTNVRAAASTYSLSLMLVLAALL